jgi:biopolymer transport protein ExbB/TolQ/predicted Zn-dependent protease
MNGRLAKHIRNLLLVCLSVAILVGIDWARRMGGAIDFDGLAALAQRSSLIHIYMKGGPIMWPLSLASILALGTVIDRIVFLLNERRKRDPKALSEFFAAVDQGDLAAASRISRKSAFCVLRVLGQALAHRGKSLTGALVYAQEQELKRFRGGIAILDTVITLAPLLGLLGTVTGMMGSFSLIGGELSAPGAITGGIAEALIATAFGLGIAITSLIPFNILNNRLEEAHHEIESAAKELEMRLQRTVGTWEGQPQSDLPAEPKDRVRRVRSAARVAGALTPLKRLAFVLVVAGAATCAWGQTSGENMGGVSQKLEWSSWAMAIWNDPVFQRQFIAGYGVDSEVAPRVTPEEAVTLDKVRSLMGGDKPDLPKAEDMLKKQIKPGKDCAIWHFLLGGVYFQQDDKTAEALESYRNAVKDFPRYRAAWRSMGLVCVRAGKYDEAVAAFTKMIELGGSDAYSLGFLGFAYEAKKDYQAGEAAYRNALLLQPENVQWRIGLTRCVVKEEKYGDAVTLLEVLIRNHPEQSAFWLLQAQAYLGMKENLKAAENLEVLNRLGKATADNLHLLGDIYRNEGLMDLASRTYVKALDADVNQPLTRPLLSTESLAQRGALAQAQQIAAHIHEVRDGRMDEASRLKLLKLEARLSMAKGATTAETASVLEEVVKHDPLDGEALMLLGQYHASRNEPERAIFYYERAEGIEACEANAKIRHAQVLVGMGKYADAAPLLRRAQEIKQNADVQKYLEQVERLAKSSR